MKNSRIGPARVPDGMAPRRHRTGRRRKRPVAGLRGRKRRTARVWGQLPAALTAFAAVAALVFSGIAQDATRRQLALSEQAQSADRFSRSIEQLGAGSADVRIGGIFALEKYARDVPADQPVVVQVLTAFVRSHAPNDGACHADRAVPADVQAAVTAIGRRDPGRDDRTAPWANLDLSGTCLPQVRMVRADFAGANFNGAQLSDSMLWGANFEGAFFDGAVLSGSQLLGARLRSALFDHADLRKVWLGTNDLDGCSLTGANLTDADLTGADVSKCTS